MIGSECVPCATGCYREFDSCANEGGKPRRWIWTEALRLLALAGLRAATTGEAEQMFKRNEDWMLRLGGALQAA